MNKFPFRSRLRGAFVTALLLVVMPSAQALGKAAEQGGAGKKHARAHGASVVPACSQCIRAHMEFLASDALRGRGSATADEKVAATYIASELMQYGVQPAGDQGGFLQEVPLIRRRFAIPPQLRFSEAGSGGGGEEVTLKHGLDLLALHVGQPQLSGPLQKLTPSAEPALVQKGAFVLLSGRPGEDPPGRAEARRWLQAGAAAVLIPEGPYYHNHWQEIGERLFSHTLEVADASGLRAADESTVIMLGNEAFARLEKLSNGVALRLIAPEEAPERAFTWNVLGEIPGASPKLKDSVILLSAHLDHLGVGTAVNGDSIYNGADDDASGTTAVLEFARALAKGQRPRRTVVFALFGSEELGGLGSSYFLDHSPVPLSAMAADLEVEMIGRADPALRDDEVWLTGWERSDFGPALAAHGAHVSEDPHPEQNFFTRSDNYDLAQRGVVAHTISSFGLHPDYHQPSDDLAHIDFKHLNEVITSLLRPLQWLANSDFVPQWKEGGKP